LTAKWSCVLNTVPEQPKVIKPTPQQFFHEYYSTSNICLFSKIGYHPFSKTFFKGLNISAGLAFGYTSQSREFQATLIYEPALQINIRRSYLEYINGFIFGYRVTLPFAKHVLFGARLDFENYTNLGDINTNLGGKVAYEF
jgi:hypothetical protein